MSEATPQKRIERLYHEYRAAGGQEAQLALDMSADQIAAAFEITVEAVGKLRANGPFYPAGTRKALFDLERERDSMRDQISDTEHLQAMLWSPTRWSVQVRPDLDFVYVAREVSPASGMRGGKREWVIEEELRVSADVLLMNAGDRTPIIAEFKRGGDQNVDYALVQALAATAQLTPERQRRRLRDVYKDYFGSGVPQLLDVYVIVVDRPRTGTRPELLSRALRHRFELTQSGRLSKWIRRIEFLEVVIEAGQLRFGLLDEEPGWP